MPQQLFYKKEEHLNSRDKISNFFWFPALIVYGGMATITTSGALGLTAYAITNGNRAIARSYFKSGVLGCALTAAVLSFDSYYETASVRSDRLKARLFFHADKGDSYNFEVNWLNLERMNVDPKTSVKDLETIEQCVKYNCQKYKRKSCDEMLKYFKTTIASQPKSSFAVASNPIATEISVIKQNGPTI